MAWDKTAPDGDTPISQGDNVIRENFAYLEETIGSDSGDAIDAFAGSGNTGYLTPRAGTLAARASLNPLAVEGMIYIITDYTPNAITRYNGSSWDGIGHVNDDGELVITAEDTIIDDSSAFAAGTGPSDTAGDAHTIYEDATKAAADTIAVIERIAGGEYKLWLRPNGTVGLQQVVTADELALANAGQGIKLNATKDSFDFGFPSPDFDSGEIDFPYVGTDTVAHGQTGLPQLVLAWFVCKSAADSDWSVDDMIPFVGLASDHSGDSTRAGIALGVDGTNFKMASGFDGTSSVTLPDFQGTSGRFMVAASGGVFRDWKFIIRGWW